MPSTYQVYVHRCGRTARGNASGKAVSLVGENDRSILKLALKNSQDAVKHRVIPTTVLQDYTDKVNALAQAVAEVLQEEKEEKEMSIAEMEIKRAQNRIEHEEEILSRPARVWFQTEHEKQNEKGIVIIWMIESSTDPHTFYIAFIVKSKVVDASAPKRTKMDGMSRRKKRLYIARQEDKKENAKQSIAAKYAKKATMPGKIGKLYDAAQSKAGKSAKSKNGGGSAGKGKKRGGGSLFASEKSGVKKART